MMDANKTTRADLVHYGSTADRLNLPGPWKEYAARLAFGLFGADTRTGDAFLRRPGLLEKEPTELLAEMTRDLKAGDSVPGALSLAGTDPHRTEKKIWTAQMGVCLPLIEDERCTYIANQHGRILCVLGQEYWDRARGETRILWNGRENRAVEDPYELDIATLSGLSDLCKVIPHGAVKSYTFFYIMHPYERERLQFAAGVRERLGLFRRCAPEVLDRLFTGHEAFIAHWEDMDPMQFM